MNDPMRRDDLPDAECAIEQALGIVGDLWTLLIVRDVAGGIHRFDQLQAELGVSRKVLTERLNALVDHRVLERRQYLERPPRFEYHLTAVGHGLLPVLVALQDWGTRHVMGDGTLTATAAPDSRETQRVHALVGTRVPDLVLDVSKGGLNDPIAPTHWTVLYCFPGAYAPSPDAYPPGWGSIPGATGCTLESVTYRDRLDEFTARNATVLGVSTQRPDQLQAFAEHERIPFPLMSDQQLELAGSLRLPTFRAAGADRLKRLTLLVRDDRQIAGVLYPVPDPAGSVDDMLAMIDAQTI